MWDRTRLTVASTSAAGVIVNGNEGSDAYTISLGGLGGSVNVADTGTAIEDRDTVVILGT